MQLSELMGVLYFLTWLHFSGAFSLTVIPVTMLHFYNLFCQCLDFFFLKLLFAPIFWTLVALHSLFVWFPVIVNLMWACCNIRLSCPSSFSW